MGLFIKTHINRDGIHGLVELKGEYDNRNRQTNLPHVKKDWNVFGPRKAEEIDGFGASLGIGLALNHALRKFVEANEPRLTHVVSSHKRLQNDLEYDGPVFVDGKTGSIYGYPVEYDPMGRLMFQRAARKLLATRRDYGAARSTLGQQPKVEESIEALRQKTEDELGSSVLLPPMREYYQALVNRHAQLADTDIQKPVIGLMADTLDEYLVWLAQPSSGQKTIAPIV